MCPLPPGVDVMALSRRAAGEGIFLAPSQLFELADQNGESALRINIAHANNHKLLRFLQAAVLK